MLRIAGAVERSFTFPANLAAACQYYRQFEHIFSLLPHITKVKAYNAEDFRMLYNTVELGVYQVRIYCDLRARFDAKQNQLRVVPLIGHVPIRGGAGMNSLTAQGTYTSTSFFQAIDANTTKVEYRLELRATLPKPFGLGLVPNGVVERIAREITHWRIHEIADGFVERSIEDYERQGKKRKG